MAQSRNIRVDTGDIRSTSSQIAQLASDYDGLYKDVLGKMQDMSATWGEIDARTFIDQVEGFRDDFERMRMEMDRYAEFLTKSAAAYEQTQDTAISQAKTLIN